MLAMLALAAIWRALHQPERSCRWLAAASVAYGLAAGARPSLLFGAVILLVPVIAAWCEPRRVWTLLMAATTPIILIGLGLMLYNALRFDSPFEFGQHYELGGRRQDVAQFFSLRYLWFNFRVCCLEPARWSTRSPFVLGSVVPSLPAGYTQVRRPFGVLTNIPLVWLALAVPLAWRSRSAQEASTLRWFLTIAALVSAVCALTLELFCGSNFRYEVDFLPALVLLAVAGIFGLERALAPTSESGQVDRPVWRRAVRAGYGLLLGFSVVFNLLASVEHYAEAHYNLGFVLQQGGKLQDAIRHYETALRIEPDYAEAHNKLGTALGSLNRLDEAIRHLEEALRISPKNAEVHNNLGVTLGRLGKLQEAIGHFEEALRIKPNYAEAHRNLGVALVRLGRLQEAIGHFGEALRLRPDDAEAHYNMGVVLEQAGRLQDAIGHYMWALRIRPDYPEARNALAKLQARQ